MSTQDIYEFRGNRPLCDECGAEVTGVEFISGVPVVTRHGSYTPPPDTLGPNLPCGHAGATWVSPSYGPGGEHAEEWVDV